MIMQIPCDTTSFNLMGADELFGKHPNMLFIMFSY